MLVLVRHVRRPRRPLFYVKMQSIPSGLHDAASLFQSL